MPLPRTGTAYQPVMCYPLCDFLAAPVEGLDHPPPRLATLDVLPGRPQDEPAHQGGLVVLRYVGREPAPPGVPTADVDRAFDLQRHPLGGPSEVERPPPAEVFGEAVLPLRPGAPDADAHELPEHLLLEVAHRFPTS